ncbi:TIGR03899 family protein [Catenovulum sp. SM1970]|uniref:TIGR03899 family protein n=1 Tax=Marinifaba aquimaris TaxID=2741323 RepID=UPI001571AACE|nr:TIGR03899 family protein [Marinifaba aquimaris]NTS78603.1 TIGR03899 family protein [Marinifaba aquimaris]
MKITSTNQAAPIITPANGANNKSDKKVTEEVKAQAQSEKYSTLSSQQKLTLIAKQFHLDKRVQQGKSERESRFNRAQLRRQEGELIKQQNLENIMSLALDYVDSSNSMQDVDPDWLHQFFELAERAYSEHMQALWGKILAIQVAKPGAFSLKSIKTLQQMTVKEAIALQHACCLMCREKGEYGGRIISGYFKPVSLFGLLGKPSVNRVNLSSFGLSYPNLLTLIDLGLIYAVEIESGPIANQKVVEFDAQGKQLKLQCNQGGAALQYYKFTQMGNELSKLIKVAPNASYYQHLASLFVPIFNFSIAS